MKQIVISFASILAFSTITAYASPQGITGIGWKKEISVQAGFAPGNLNWEYRHPLYTGTGGVLTLRETGSYRSGTFFSGRFALSGRYLGFGAAGGYIPASIQVDKTAETYDFSSYFIELGATFYPFKGPMSRFTPYTGIGAGGVFTTGELETTAILYTFDAGLRVFFFKNFGVNIELKVRHFIYDEVPLGTNLSGDVNLTNIAGELGLVFMF